MTAPTREAQRLGRGFFDVLWCRSVFFGGLLTLQRKFTDRDREGRLILASPPAKPDVQVARIRLSGQ